MSAPDDTPDFDAADFVATVSTVPPETVPVSSLTPHPRNYQEHPDDQIEHLVESLREHGQYSNVVIAQDGTLLAGHGVWLAHQRAGLATIEVRRMPYGPDEPRALKLLLGDNLITHLAMRDDRLTAELLKDVADADPDGLLGTGFDAAMLANLVFVTRPAGEIRDFDAAAHWAGLPEYDRGQGSFRLILLCDTAESRAEAAAVIGAPHVAVGGDFQKQQVSVRWPLREKYDDPRALAFIAGDAEP